MLLILLYKRTMRIRLQKWPWHFFATYIDVLVLDVVKLWLPVQVKNVTFHVKVFLKPRVCFVTAKTPTDWTEKMTQDCDNLWQPRLHFHFSHHCSSRNRWHHTSVQTFTWKALSRFSHSPLPTPYNFQEHNPSSLCNEYGEFEESWCLCQPGWISLAFVQQTLGILSPHRYLSRLSLNQNPCNFEVFKTAMKYFLKYYRAQSSF